MKYTLLFYTDGWKKGPEINLSVTPTVGSVVWLNDRREQYEHDMYYVDNVMFADSGINGEDVVYLYVRPYTGYSRYAPKTESDRLAENMDKLLGEQRKTNELLELINGRLTTLIIMLNKQSIDDGDNRDRLDKSLSDIIYALETICDRME